MAKFITIKNGNFSDPATWDQGTATPAAGDVVLIVADKQVTVDQPGLSCVEVFQQPRSTLILDADFEVTGKLFCDDSAGIIRNGNSRLFAGELQLMQRVVQDAKPGDRVATRLLMQGVHERPVAQLDLRQGSGETTGLSIDNAADSALNIAAPADPTLQRKLTLHFDAAQHGGRSWGLRWKGDHADALRAMAPGGASPTVLEVDFPASVTFDPATHIAYDSAEDYTYVGYNLDAGEPCTCPSADKAEATGGSSTQSNYPNFVDIPGLAGGVDVSTGDKVLITLTAPDTWSDANGGQGWFAIEVDGSVVARGLYTSANAQQRVPISLQQLVTATQDGHMNIKGRYCRGNTGTVHLGGLSPSVLTWVKFPG